MKSEVPRLYAARSGTAGPRVVLLHGAGGCHHVWHYFVRRLGRSARVWALDLPGHCKSEPPPEHTFDEFLRILRLWFDEALGGAPEVVVGHSMGGLLALGLAAQEARIQRLVVLSAALRIPVQPRRRVDPQEVEDICRRIYHQERWIRWCVKHRSQVILSTPPIMLRDLEMVRQVDLRPLAPRIRQPVHLAVGRYDQAVTEPLVRETLNLLPSARLTWLEHSGHMPHLEEAARVAELIEEELRHVQGA